MVWIGRNVLMLEGLGEPKKTFDADDFESRKKAISPFDFVKSVTDTKENLIVDDWSEKQYNALRSELNEIIGELNAIESKLEGIIPYTKNKGANWKKD